MQVKGFTIIELLVSVLIIGILVAVALPKYQTAVDKARYLQLLTLTESLSRAEEGFYDSKGKYTNKLDALPLDLVGERIKKANMSNSAGELVEVDRFGSVVLGKNVYVTLDYVEGFTPEGSYRNDGYVYGIDGNVGLSYIHWLQHMNTRAWGHMEGQRYCVVYQGRTGATSAATNTRGHRLCKALGGKNVTSPSWANDPNKYLLP